MAINSLLPISEARIFADLNRLCDCGGRLAGTPSEEKARNMLRAAGAEALSVPCREEWISYQGWWSDGARMTLPDGSSAACWPLIRSAATPAQGLCAEVLDLGRGSRDDFAAQADRIAGRIVMVRHEVMFSASTIHRRKKIRAARDAGALGVLVAGREARGYVAGSSRTEDEPAIPACGISGVTAEKLRARPEGLPKATLHVDARGGAAETANLFFDLPGSTDEWVVLSAHLDGHALSESAIDNASGVAVALEVARCIRDHGPHRRGLRLAFFSIEEWGLTGSARHIAGLTSDTLRSIALNVNLDSVAGSPNMTALSSEFAGLDPFLRAASEEAGIPLHIHRPLQANSDHASYAQAGVPAFRLVAGFDEPDARTRFVLTPDDMRDAIEQEELSRAARLAYTLVCRALNADDESSSEWRSVRT